MSVMRFVGETSREAMRKVRAALGDEALILANRPSESGVEILAMADEAVDAMAASQAAAPSSSGAERGVAPSASSTRSELEPAAVAPAAPASAPTGQSGLEAMSERLLREMQDMRALLARQPASPAPASVAADDRGREALARVLREAGFGRAVADDVLQGLPSELADAEADSEAAHAWLVRRLASRLSTGVDPETFLDTPGILALIGPTGVGKTTTTAKLAARCVQRHGPDNVALVTTDGFRVGAHEQLRIYAELLGVPLHALSPEQSMDDLLAELSGRRWVIIDTVGMSQRDQRIIAQAAQLQGGAERVRMLLVLNAASQPGTLEEVVTRYRQAARAAGVALDDTLLTKQDEAGQLGPALDTLIRHGLRLRFVSTGQRVPEDLAPAEASPLIEAALGAARVDDDLPVAAARDARPGAEALLGQGRRLGLLLDALRHRLTGFATLEAAWDLSALPGCLQEPRLARLLEAPPESLARPGMLWAARRRLPGADWAMPDLGIDDGGGWLVLPDLQQRQPVGWPGRLERAHDAQGVGVHLLPAPPDAETWLWLDESRAPWICQARPGQRVVHGGERLALSSLEPLAEAVETRDCRFRGQGARARFARLAVEAGPGGRRGAPASCAMSAWFATLVDPESGRTLGQRYWLTPLRSAEDALPLLLGRLHGEALPRQVRRAWERLQGTLPAETDREVCQLLAAGLAAAAGHLDQAGDAEAEQLRRDLLSLLGGRRRRREGALLEALLHLLMARDAIRHVGAAGLEGVR